MAFISCPCGFRAETDDDFDLDKAQQAFDEHGCPNHAPKVEQPKRWHESVGAMFAALVFLLILTSPCWGLAGIAAVSKLAR